MSEQELLQDKQKLMRRCYEICEQAEWIPDNLYSRHNLPQSVIKKNALEYIQSVLKTPLTKEQIWFFFSGKTRVIIDTYNGIIKVMIKLDVINREQFKNVEWVNNNLKDIIYKFCYDISAKNHWISTELEKYCAQNDLDIKKVRYAAKLYVSKVLKLDEKQQDEHKKQIDQIRQKRMCEQPNGKYAKAFQELLVIDDEFEIIYFLEKFGKRPGQIKDAFVDFITVYHGGSKVIKENLERKIKIYVDYVNDIKRAKKKEQKVERQALRADENFKTAKKTIKFYLNKKYERKQDFCLDLGITNKQFNEYVDLIREQDPKLYSQYSSYAEEVYSRRFKSILATANMIVEMIKKGINENGIIREFDMVDYYTYTQLSFEQLLEIIKGNMNIDDYRILRIFISKHQNDKEMSPKDLENLYNTKTILGANLDKNGNPIPGTGREITHEDKENIIKYLNDNNIPLTNRTYNIVYRRWLSGNLIFEKEKIKLNRY